MEKLELLFGYSKVT